MTKQSIKQKRARDLRGLFLLLFFIVLLPSNKILCFESKKETAAAHDHRFEHYQEHQESFKISEHDQDHERNAHFHITTIGDLFTLEKGQNDSLPILKLLPQLVSISSLADSLLTETFSQEVSDKTLLSFYVSQKPRLTVILQV